MATWRSVGHGIQILILSALVFSDIRAQPVAPTETSSATPTASVSAAPATVTPLDLSDVATQLVESQSLLSELHLRLEEEQTQARALAPGDFSSSLERQATATLKLLGQHPTIQDLKDAEKEWLDRADELKSVVERLAATDKRRGSEQEALESQDNLWSATLTALQKDIPAPLREEIERLRADIHGLKTQENEARQELLLGLTHLAQSQSRVENLLETIAQARAAKVKQVLVKDGRPLWKVDVASELRQNVVGNLAVSLEGEQKQLFAYATTNAERFLFHLFCFGLFLTGLRWCHRRVQPWAAQEPALDRTVRVFSSPSSTAPLLTVFLTPLIYPRAPVLMTLILAALSLVPAILVLRRLLETRLYPLLNALVVLFCIDQIRALAASELFLTRLIFLFEMLGALIFFAGFRRRLDRDGRPFLAVGCSLFGAIFAVALLSNFFGYLELSYWMGDGLLHSAYLAVFLYASVEVLGGLTLLILRLPPFSLLASVRRDRPRLRRRLRVLVRLLAGAVWLFVSLDSMALLTPLSQSLGRVLTAPLTLGAVSLTLGGLLAAVLILWLARKLSQGTLYVLELDVYPRFRLERGVDYTLSTLIHYLILVLGALFGLAVVGVDSTKFTIVAGALSVGIGFGLQNIVNNFVSGLILLFERPVKVGDTVEFNNQLGLLKRVGLRASVLRTQDGAEVIVPNGQLLSVQVTNWTLSDPKRRLHLDIGVAYGSQPREVEKLLLQAADECADILKEPSPSVLFVGLGESSLDFRLQFWTERCLRWPALQSDLLFIAYDLLTEAGISIPFPHRTVTVQSWPDSKDLQLE